MVCIGEAFRRQGSGGKRIALEICGYASGEKQPGVKGEIESKVCQGKADVVASVARACPLEERFA